jgi:hypothetical protein
MSRISTALDITLSRIPKPVDSAPQPDKKRYSELVSQKVAICLAKELRDRGLKEARPAGEGELGDSGAERQMAGGLGAKKVDVTWATAEAGLIFAISVKTINFKDNKTQNFQKNLINRRGDLLMEAVTLHRRFPYAVLCAFFFLDADAANDGTDRRESTFINAHKRLKMFTGRNDPSGREEQYERFYLLLLDSNKKEEMVKAYSVGDELNEKSLEGVFDEMLALVAERNPDFYEYKDGNLVSI